MFFKKKRRVRKSKITDKTIAEALGILITARRELILFQFENEVQQRVRDYLVEEMGKTAELLCKEWNESD